MDALWITPWYVSPMADGGYDVADYRDIDPLFGTLAEAEELIGAAHAAGLKMIIDLVPNHCSDHHPWFTAAVAGRARLGRASAVLVPARPGADGEQPPNDWPSMFGGPAWTRVTEPDGSPGEWYLHLYAREQPDLNWDDPEVRAEFESILRFWLDRGIDGFRIDVADFLVKDPALPDVAGLPRGRPQAVGGPGRPARHLPAVAGGHRLLPGRAAVRRRDVAEAAHQAAAVPDRRPAAHRVQLRLPGHRLGCRASSADVIELTLTSIGAGRALGAVEPRRDPAPDPVRTR